MVIMTQVWRAPELNEFQCCQCGALYELSLARIESSCRDEAVCQVCNRVMTEWRGTLVPSYKLMRRPDRSPKLY